MRYAKTSRAGRKARATKRKAGDERTRRVRPTAVEIGVNTTLFRPIKSPEIFKVVS